MKRRRDFFRKTQHKRYESRSFRNPYFQDKTKQKHLLILLAVVLTIILSIVSLFTLLFHPLFHIRQVRVTGLETLLPSDVDQELRVFFSKPVYVFFTRQNRFLFSEQFLTEKLREAFTLGDLQIKRQGNQLHIILTERTSHLRWKSGDREYLADLEGVIIREVNSEDPAVLPLFVDRQAVEVTTGKNVLTREEISAVFRFQELLLAQNILFTQTEFDRLEGKWTGILTQEGYRILFDTAGDIEAQNDRLRVLNRETIKDFTKLQYIDLRFGDHVYYK